METERGTNWRSIRGDPRRRSIWPRCTFTCQRFEVLDMHVIFKSWSTYEILQKQKKMFNVSKSVRMWHQRQCLRSRCAPLERIESIHWISEHSCPFHFREPTQIIPWEAGLKQHRERMCCLHTRGLKAVLKFLAHCSPICLTFVCNRSDLVENSVAGLHICKVLQWSSWIVSRKSDCNMLQVEYLIAIPWEIRFQ